jgi:prephenate dehydrogenase
MGLIGSSVARLLVEKNLVRHVAAFDTNRDSLAYAAQQGFAHSQHAHAGQAAQDADLIIFATPPTSFAALARDIAPFVKPQAVLTDVASVKRHAVAAITPVLAYPAMYVPGHPVAGSEMTGPQAGRADLFKGRHVILTPQEDQVLSDPVGKIRILWEAAEAKIEFMPPEMHDRIYAYVSHLPQLVAYAAWEPLKFLSTGDETFARFTRLAKSHPDLWADISITNSDYICEALTGFIAFATQIQGELNENDAPLPDAEVDMSAILFPKIVATCLVATTSLLQEQTGVHPARYCGKGFTDMVSPAMQDPDATLAAISSHPHQMAGMLRVMLDHLMDIKDAVHLQSRRDFMKALGLPDERLSA